MSDSILFHHDPGSACYVLALDRHGQVWNGSALVPFVSADLGNYAITAVELGTNSGLYRAAVPALPADLYAFLACVRAGAQPALSDTRVAVGDLAWDGSAIIVTPSRQQITGGSYALATNAAGQVRVAPDPALASSVSDAAPTASAFAAAAGLSAQDDFYHGALLAFTGGALHGLARRVVDYHGATRTLTVSPAFPAAPADGDPFLILGRVN